MAHNARPPRRSRNIPVLISTFLVLGLVVAGPAAASAPPAADRSSQSGPPDEHGQRSPDGEQTREPPPASEAARPDQAAAPERAEEAAQGPGGPQAGRERAASGSESELPRSQNPQGPDRDGDGKASGDRARPEPERGTEQGARKSAETEAARSAGSPKAGPHVVSADHGSGREGRGNGKRTSGAVAQGGTTIDRPDRTPSDPPGNRGSIKIDGRPFDERTDNEPHPGCDFRVTMFGFVDSYADVTVDAHAPTGGARPVDGERVDFPDGAANRRGNELAGASDVHDVVPRLADAGIEPHPRNGYHLKVTVESENAHGSNAKHKVLWLDCPGEDDGEAVAGASTAPPQRGPVSGDRTPPLRTVTPPSSGTVQEDLVASAGASWPMPALSGRAAGALDTAPTIGSDEVLGLVVERGAVAASGSAALDHVLGLGIEARTTATAAAPSAEAAGLLASSPTPQQPAQLAATGADARTALVLALLALAAGALLLHQARRRTVQN